MASQFNFTAKLGLNSAGFHKGVAKVKSSVNGLKSSFLSLAGALGAGLGFAQLITKVKDTATELSTVMNTLKNVSYQTKNLKGGTEETAIEVSNFADNLEFVKRVSREYHQDLVAITDNYAKFTAACKKTNLGLDDQRFVFESLTKAAAYYHLSADRTSDMMNAIVQMMSKGKVAAEELRRQLGNTLPGAFNMMAAAIGVSTLELEDMMRKGQVISSEVLPKFAAMLNSVTQNVEFDSIQASLNDFKNTWYEFIEKSGAEDLYKRIVDGASSSMRYITDNMNGIKSSVVGLVTFFASVNLFGFLEKQGAATIKKTQDQLDLLANKLTFTKRRIESFGGKQGLYGAFTHAHPTSLSSTQIKEMQEYNRALSQQATLQYKLGTITKEKYRATQAEIAKATAQLRGLEVETNAAAVSAGRVKTAWQGVGAAIGRFGAQIENFLKSNWMFIAISIAASILNYMKNIKEEAKRIAAISDEYANEINGVKAKTEQQAAILRNDLKIIKDMTASESSRILALKEINRLLGLTGKDAFDVSVLEDIESHYDDITAAVERWIEATKKQALIQAFASQIADATAKKGIAQGKLKNKEEELSALEQIDLGLKDYWKLYKTGGVGMVIGTEGALWKGGNDVKREIENLKTEIAEYDEVIGINEKAMKDLGTSMGEYYDILSNLGGNSGGGGKSGLKGLAKIIADHNEEAKKLHKQFIEGVITQEEFNEAFNDLLQKTLKAAAGTGEVSIADIIKKQSDGTALSEVEKWYVDIRDKAIEYAQTVIMDGLAKSMMKDVDEYLKRELEESERELEKLLEGNKDRMDFDNHIAGATSELKTNHSLNKRDATFDYKKSKSDILGEDADMLNDQLDNIKDKITELLEKERELFETTGQGLGKVAQQELTNLQAYYRQLSKESKTVEDAFRFEKISEDIKEFQKNMAQGIFSGIENFATSMDRVVTGARELRDLMENVDATGWEQMMGVINYIFSILNAITSVIDTINTLSELGNMLAAARAVFDSKKLADTALQTEGTVAQIAAEETLAGVKAQQVAFETTITANKVAQAEAALGVATALGVETAAWIALAAAQKDAAMAAAAANAAMVSGPAAPAAALAAAAEVGAGLTATMAAFAKGGIVGGNSTHGDRNLARVNSGEMILNKAQQGTLWGLLNGKGGLGGNVEFKIRGADLVGTINNYSSRKRG